MPRPRVVIHQRPAPPPEHASVEFCEHKGIGHPDSLCDGAVEAVSRALCRAYLQAYGQIQHYNVDKALLIGGASAPRYGGGVLRTPLRLLVCGRATPLPGGDLAALIVGAADEYLRSVLRPEAHVIAVESVVRTGSPNLARVVGQARMSPLANDTSFGCGFAPASRLESTVLLAADSLRSDGLRTRFPALGDDVKVMGARLDDELQLTVAIALVDRHVPDVESYFQVKRQIVGALNEITGHTAVMTLNALDDPASRTPDGVYLTVTGLSAEHGDDGQVGRGNRANRLITPHRTMSLEATAGKNSAAHVGKLYNLLAFELAHAIVRAHPHVRDASVQLLSTIGRPACAPAVVAIELQVDPPADPVLEVTVREITRACLANMDALTARLVAGTVSVF